MITHESIADYKRGFKMSLLANMAINVVDIILHFFQPTAAGEIAAAMGASRFFQPAVAGGVQANRASGRATAPHISDAGDPQHRGSSRRNLGQVAVFWGFKSASAG